MIRPFTLITMLLAALSGAYLFAVKHKAQVLDNEIAAYGQSSRLDAMRIRVLQGQWSMETDPTRLQQLAAQFTNLQPMQPAQLVTLAALRESLPPPGSAAPGINPALPMQAVQQLAANDVAQNALAPNGLPFPPPPAPSAPAMLASASVASAPVTVASLAPATATSFAPAAAVATAASRPVAHKVSHSALHMANTQMAESLPAPKPYYAPKPPREVVQTASLAPGPMGAQVMSVKATSVMPQYVQPVSSQDGGSVLGMASNLAPPQPLPQNGSNN